MHELSLQARKILDAVIWLFAASAAAMTLERMAAIVTIGAGLVSIACGFVRLHDWRERRRARTDPIP